MESLDQPLDAFEISEALLGVLRELGMGSLREVYVLGSKTFLELLARSTPRGVAPIRRKKWSRSACREMKDIFEALGYEW